MLELFAANQVIDFDKVNFTITLKNPMFATDSYQGSYIFNFTLPATLRNRKIFNVIDPLQIVSTEKIDYPFSLIYKGLSLIQNGLITVVKNTAKLITVNVKVATGDFNYQMKDKYLHRLDLGFMSFENDASALSYFNDNVESVYPQTSFALPNIIAVQNSYLPSGTTGFYYKDSLNHYEIDTYFLLDGTGNKGVIVPMLYNRFVLEKIFSLSNYTLNDEFFSNNEDLTRLILFNHYNINGGIPATENGAGYPSEAKFINFANHVPQIKVLDYLLGLQNMFNISFFFHHNRKQVTIKDLNSLIDATDIVDFSENVITNKTISETAFSGYEISAKADPNDDFFSGKETIQSDFLASYGGAIDLISNLPDRFLGDIYYYVEEDDNFYAWDFIPTPGQWVIDNSFSERLISTYFKGDKELSLSSEFSTLCNNPVFGDYYMTFANSANTFREFAPRLVFYNGLQDVGGIDYPLSHYSRHGLSLFLGGDDGLVNKRWKSFLDWRCALNKEVQFKKMISPIEFMNLEFWKKHRILDENYFLKEVKIPFVDNKIQAATITAIKV